mgnify:CR=1 FL=1
MSYNHLDMYRMTKADQDRKKFDSPLPTHTHTHILCRYIKTSRIKNILETMSNV